MGDRKVEEKQTNYINISKRFTNIGGFLYLCCPGSNMKECRNN